MSFNSLIPLSQGKKKKKTKKTMASISKVLGFYLFFTDNFVSETEKKKLFVDLLLKVSLLIVQE